MHSDSKEAQQSESSARTSTEKFLGRDQRKEIEK